MDHKLKRVPVNGQARDIRLMARRMVNNQVIADGTISRAMLSRSIGKTYAGKRDLYESLGYPEDRELIFEYYLAKYKRNAIANAVIDRPANKTWTGPIHVLSKEESTVDSELNAAWEIFKSEFKIKSVLKKTDKLANLGRFAIILFGFDDVRNDTGFKIPVGGNKVKLVYLKSFPEGSVEIKEWEQNSSNIRYGQPNIYSIKVSEPGKDGFTKTVEVHHSRILHVNTEDLTSSIYGTPALEPIINRLIDIEKLLGGDAEMFWRGARPGYTALSRPDYDMGDPEIEALEGELDKYEHDLRRFITAQGVDIKALEQQVADPLNHLDAQIQAISAQTSIPKRILIGSERGELSSAQDANEWLSLIQTRQEEFAEPFILRPFINKCMDLGLLPKVDSYNYNVVWQDVFSPSEKEKVNIGKVRADSLKIWSDSGLASTMIPFEIFAKMFLGFTEEQINEIVANLEELNIEVNDDPPQQEEDEEEMVA